MAKFIAAVILALSISTAAQQVPRNLLGRWIVHRELPASTISCWGDTEAKRIIGTSIEYRADSFRWQEYVVDRPVVKVKVVSAKQFHDENSGGGANDSQVTLQQLGIRSRSVQQVEFAHEAAEITGATTEIPGDKLLIKDANTIVFAVCNVYFEAKRAPKPAPARR